MSSGEKPACVFNYSETRSQRVPLALLSSDTHAMMVDGYEGYGKACDIYDITRIGCWAHARRKFVEAKSHQPKGKTGKADQALAHIQKLYALEKVIKDDPPDKRYKARQEKANPFSKN